MTATHFISPLVALVAAPLMLGIIVKTKALFAGRTGAPVLQVYYDIGRLLRKGATYSTTTSWIFRAGPMVSLAALIAAVFIVPIGAIGAPLSFSGDIFLFIYLLGIVRFFTVIAALDTGSAFEGMGASREVFFSAIAEPVFLISLIALGKATGNFNLYEIFGVAGSFTIVPGILAGASLFVVALAENSRIPVDDPTTHLELTMIHEVMVLDHSGPDFAFITYGAALKLWLTGLIVIQTILPVHTSSVFLDLAVNCASMCALSVVIGTVESVMARLRLLRVPQFLIGAGALAILALLIGKGGLL